MARSNRQLTQFAVDKMRQLLVHGPEGFVNASAGNTAVELEYSSNRGNPSPVLVVKLFQKEILRVFLSPVDNRTVTSTVVSAGGFYDSKGRPSRTTRERLNGLLDSLGSTGFIPEGVRVFLGTEGDCRLGKGEAYKHLDSEHDKSLILSSSTELMFG